MKIATIIAQVLVGMEFVVFGLNPFLHFLPATLPPGLGGQFLSILFESKYVLFVGAVQVIGGALLMINRYVSLGLTLLAGVVFNIFLFYGLVGHAGWEAGVVEGVFWVFFFFRYQK